MTHHPLHLAAEGMTDHFSCLLPATAAHGSSMFLTNSCPVCSPLASQLTGAVLCSKLRPQRQQHGRHRGHRRRTGDEGAALCGALAPQALACGRQIRVEVTILQAPVDARHRVG